MTKENCTVDRTTVSQYNIEIEVKGLDDFLAIMKICTLCHGVIGKKLLFITRLDLDPNYLPYVQLLVVWSRFFQNWNRYCIIHHLDRSNINLVLPNRVVLSVPEGVIYHEHKKVKVDSLQFLYIE